MSHEHDELLASVIVNETMKDFVNELQDNPRPVPTPHEFAELMLTKLREINLDGPVKGDIRLLLAKDVVMAKLRGDRSRERALLALNYCYGLACAMTDTTKPLRVIIQELPPHEEVKP